MPRFGGAFLRTVHLHLVVTVPTTTPVDISPHRCTYLYMSINMDGSGDVDYSDFEYETFSFEGFGTGSGSPAEVNVDFEATYEPLTEVGGLDVNEVAELVYMELYAAVEFEDEFADQNVASDGEMRGVIGANLDRDDLHFHGPNTADVESTAQTSGSAADVGSQVKNRDEIFALFSAYGSAPADDQTDGPGSNGASNVTVIKRPFRQMTGRGPVLDSQDDIVAEWRVIAGDSIIPVGGSIRGHLVYDISETDDAGRRFSVPR